MSFKHQIKNIIKVIVDLDSIRRFRHNRSFSKNVTYAAVLTYVYRNTRRRHSAHEYKNEKSFNSHS